MFEVWCSDLFWLLYCRSPLRVRAREVIVKIGQHGDLRFVGHAAYWCIYVYFSKFYFRLCSLYVIHMLVPTSVVHSWPKCITMLRNAGKSVCSMQIIAALLSISRMRACTTCTYRKKCSWYRKVLRTTQWQSQWRTQRRFKRATEQKNFFSTNIIFRSM